MYYYSRQDSGELNGHYQEWSYEWQLKWHNCDSYNIAQMQYKFHTSYIHTTKASFFYAYEVSFKPNDY